MNTINLDQCSIKDIEDFFSLNEKNYSSQDILDKKSRLSLNVMNDAGLANNTKQEVISFLEKASERLIYHIQPIHSYNTQMITDGKMFGRNNVFDENGHFLIETPGFHGSMNMVANSGSGSGKALRKRAINIDTRFRDNYFTTRSTDIQFVLPVTFEKVVSMRLAALEIPIAFYAVSAAQGNNVLRIDWKSGGSAGVYDSSAVIVLPDGNYSTGVTPSSLSNIATELNTLIQATLAGGAGGVLKLRYSVDVISGRSVFVQDAAAVSTIPFKVSFQVTNNGTIAGEELPLQLTLGWMLGFRGAVYESPGGTSGAASTKVVSEGICNIQGPRYLFVAIDDYNNSGDNYFVSAFANSTIAPNIIARLNVSALTGAAVNGSGGVSGTSTAALCAYSVGHEDGLSTQLNRSRAYNGPVTIQKLRITLYDEYGRIVNLNYMDWSLSLVFEVLQ